jgi:hypothetical protein
MNIGRVGKVKFLIDGLVRMCDLMIRVNGGCLVDAFVIEPQQHRFFRGGYFF